MTAVLLSASNAASFGPVVTFLKSQRQYDLKTSYPAQFLKANPAMAAEIEKGIRDKANVLQEELLGSPEPDANEGDESL